MGHSIQQGSAQTFHIFGWAREDGSLLKVGSQAEIDLARTIIKSEAAALEARLKPIEKKLKRGTKAYEKVKASKNRPVFDIQVQQRDAGAVDEKPAYFAPHHFHNESPLEPERVGMQAMDWLVMRFPGLGPVVGVGPNTQNPQREIATEAGFVVSDHAPGMGEPIISGNGLGDRMRPAADSFAVWFTSTNAESRSSVSFFLLDESCGRVDVDLLQTRLAPHHIICSAPGSEASEALLATWDGGVYEMNDALIFTDPGPRYLDIIHGGGSHIPDNEWPKISVVTVSYNQAKFLEECLTSVLEQGYPNLEYIVVDAVSDDGSIDILERYRDRIDTLIIEKDNGQSDGLNKGFDQATGDIYTWINSDDMLVEGALKRAALAFMKYGTDMVAGGCERTGPMREELMFVHYSALPYTKPVPLGFPQNLIWQNSWERGDYFFQPEVVFSARIWKQAGACLKEHLYWAMDWELWIRMAMAGAHVVNIPDRIGLSREHPDQKTTGEELYLHQLRNILLETEDALQAVEKLAPDLPAGEPIEWTVEQQQPEVLPSPSLVRRLMGLRHPHRLRRAVISRLKPHHAQRLRSLRERTRKRTTGTASETREAQLETALSRLSIAEQERFAAQAKSNQMQVDLNTAQARLADLSAKQAQVQALVVAAQSQEENYERSLSEMRDAYARSVKKQRDTYQRSLKGMQTAHENTVATLHTTYAASVAQMEEASDKAHEGARQASAHIEALEEEAARLRLALEEMNETSIEERERLSGHIEETTDFIDELKIEVERLQASLTQAIEHRDEAVSYNGTLKQNARQQKKEIASITKHRDEAVGHNAELQSSYSKVASVLEQKNRQLNEATKYNAALQQATETAEARAAGLQNSGLEATQFVAELQAEIDRLRDQAVSSKIMSEDGHKVVADADGWPQVDGAQTQNPAEHFAEFANRLLFDIDIDSDDATIALVRERLADGATFIDIMRDIARAGGEKQSLQVFRNIRHQLGARKPIPDLDIAKRGNHEFVLVDIGAEPLTFENDVYAPLVEAQDCLLVRFDPFDESNQAGRIRKTMQNGNSYRDLTFPTFVGDGEAATFHVNRFRPTSSLYEANLDLVEPFGLLKESLETVETREVETRRLDDIFKGVRWMPNGIDLLKIDVQGATQAVIENASNVLARTLIVQLEAEFSPIYKGETTFATIDATMRASGFSLLDLRDLGHMPYEALAESPASPFHAGRLLWSDVLYVRQLDDLDTLSVDELSRLAIMAHELYGKYDLAGHCLKAIDEKTKGDNLKRYVAATS